MKRKFIVVVITLISLFTQANAQTFTMSGSCRKSVQEAVEMNKQKKFNDALGILNNIEGKCNTKDGKEAIQNAKARSNNGLGKYNEAIAAAGSALKVSKNKSLNAYFERAIANEGLKNNEAATADFNRIIELTEKNQNIKERATIYAKIADLNYSAGKIPEATQNLEKAMTLDPSNYSFMVQKGDMYAKEKNYDKAFIEYDKAVAAGKTDLEMYRARTEARMKMLQEKYKTDNTQELRSKMNNTEKEQVCSELKKAVDLGMNDMSLELFSGLICK